MGKYIPWIAVVIVVVLIGFFVINSQKSTNNTLTPTPTAPTAMQKIDVQFANHIQAKLPEQDVFVIEGNDATKVVRVEGDSAKNLTVLAKEAFATATVTPHDPFKTGANPLGPFVKGADLGFTLGSWLAATGTGTYTVDSDNATMNLSFQKLVANGTYTVWCSRLTFPPNVKVVDMPCGKEDGSENVFKADATGNGTFNLTLKALEPSTKETASVIALAYHSNGKTYGANPGDFGLNSHVQLFFLVPAPGAK